VPLGLVHWPRADNSVNDVNVVDQLLEGMIQERLMRALHFGIRGKMRGTIVKLLPLPQPPLRARTDARTNPSAQRATQLRSVLARVYAVPRQNQITTTVP
jgi:hypothetical protein